MVLDAEGNVLGWTEVTVAGLPPTGFDATALASAGGIAVALIAAGALALLARRRRANA